VLRETAKNPRATTQTLQASVIKLNVKVHDRTITKKKKYGMFGRVARRKLLLSKKNMAAWLRFANLHLNK